MKFNQLILLAPAFFLFSCGGESTETNETETPETENTEVESEEETPSKPATFEATFGECAGLNQMSKTSAVDTEEYSFSMGAMEGVDLKKFGSLSAEFTENHKTLRIKFVNDPSILTKGVSQFEEGQMSMTILVASEKDDITAKTYTNDDLRIGLTKGHKVDNTSKTAGVGSNKIKREIVINKISQDRVCGSLTMTGEDGTLLVSAKFDTKLSMVAY